MAKEFNPVSGRAIFSALRDKGVIILACNTRITKGVVRGIFRAAKDTDSAAIKEFAKSECNLRGTRGKRGRPRVVVQANSAAYN